MNFTFFESLTKEEAQKYLDDFLYFGKNRGMELLEKNLPFTVDLDFSVGSLSSVFKMLIPILKTIPREPDLTLPEFIRNTDSYKKKLFDFDEESKSIVLAAACYLGQTFVNSYEQLSWATGNTDQAQGNMPVITGFEYNELPVILVAENIFSGVIAGTRGEDSIDIMIDAWKSNAEQ